MALENSFISVLIRRDFYYFSKGDVAIHNEISVFVYRYDLKQSQIARMAGSIDFLLFS